MVLPLFNIPSLHALPKVGNTVALTGSEAKHAASVRRMRVGEGIQLSDGRGNRIIGLVAKVDPAELLVTVTEAIHEPISEPSLCLVQALAKGDRDELAIQAATELGVERVIPWQADRSVSRWDGAKIAKGVDRWQSIVAEAAKQALRSRTPVVEQPVSTKVLVSALGKSAVASPTSASPTVLLVLDPTADQALSSINLPDSGEISIAVGPEGGISETELHALAAAGAIRVRLGTEILRTSTAGMAAISVLQARLGRW